MWICTKLTPKDAAPRRARGFRACVRAEVCPAAAAADGSVVLQMAAVAMNAAKGECAAAESLQSCMYGGVYV